MLLRIKTFFSKKNIKKLLRSTLCLLLCVLTVVFFGGVLAPTQAQAVAGVDDAIYFIVAFLICCGMTFTTTAAASNAAQQFYDNCPTDVQEIIDYHAEQLQKDLALPIGIAAVLQSEWALLLEQFTAQFPQYANLYQNSTSVLESQLTADTFYSSLVAGATIAFSTPGTIDTNVFIQTSASTTLRFAGYDTLKSLVSTEVYNKIYSSNTNQLSQFSIYSIPSLDFCIIKRLYGQPSFSYVKDRPYSYVYANDPLVPRSGYYALYKGQIVKIAFNSDDSFYFTNSAGNIISQWLADDVIFPNDNLINCDDLSIPYTNFAPLLLGEDVFDVGVDASSLPGIDSFPSTTGDITDVSSYPDSIPISVPRDLSDAISKTAEDIRTVDTTDEDTGDTTDTDNDKKPNKPSIPALSLPEILFKEKFPFCLPWDIYNVFANLVAEPKAPVFEIPMKWEFLDIDYTLVIDFSMFDEIARISRFFSSLGFIVFLILVSRKIIGAQ